EAIGVADRAGGTGRVGGQEAPADRPAALDDEEPEQQRERQHRQRRQAADRPAGGAVDALASLERRHQAGALAGPARRAARGAATEQPATSGLGRTILRIARGALGVALRPLET